VISLLCAACGGGDPPRIAPARRDAAQQLAIPLLGSLQNPAWSPASHAILFTRFAGGYNAGPADLFVVDLRDRDPRLLVSDGSDNVNLPGSSWNGVTGAIVFSSSRDPHDEIFSIDGGARPGRETLVTKRTDFVAYEPTLSPDGRWAVFESHRIDQEDGGVIMKAPVDGSSDSIPLTAGGDCRQPNWAPSGGRILYQTRTGSQWDIWVMNEDGTGARRVTSSPSDETDASFSPDGASIVYSSNEGGLDLANLFVVPTAGGASTRVTDWDGYDGAPAWSPDGTRIIFESFAGDPDESAGTGLWIIDAPAP